MLGYHDGRIRQGGRIVPSRRSQRPLILRPQGSRRLAAYLLLVHAAAALSVLWTPVHWGLRVTAGALILLSLGHYWRGQIRRRSRRGITEARWFPDGGWQLGFANGASCAAQLCQSSIVLPGLLILSFRCQDIGFVHLVLPSDTLDSELARELRVRLRTGVLSTQTPHGSGVGSRD